MTDETFAEILLENIPSVTRETNFLRKDTGEIRKSSKA
ncbi:unnamed protein product [Brugia pahangi]|uniref:DNA (cytosine-5-)-methyltransferase n=1 Tax=Brugia pahangi TaxID=6280 RepID=A0A0N4TQD7_BRUPA|nr:unnamed protein product [Brugia pahangi]